MFLPEYPVGLYPGRQEMHLKSFMLVLLNLGKAGGAYEAGALPGVNEPSIKYP
jgi:hypothetical protein